MDDSNKPILKRITRGKCLWIKNCDINSIEENKCDCEHYIPDGNKCKCCGHSELWHARNNKVTDMIKYDSEVKRRSYPYINSLNMQIVKLQNENKSLLEKCVVNRTSIDNYQCIICMKQPKSITFLPCRHTHFCKECADTWLTKKVNCPVCRKRVEGMLDILI